MPTPIEGLTSIPSDFGAAETLDRLEAVVRARGMTVFLRLDHAAGARSVGLELRPTELLLFGTPRAGTPLMQSAQTLGIDLPLKALAWEDASGVTWLSYEEPRWLATRHAVGHGLEEVSAKMSLGIAEFAESATKR